MPYGDYEELIFTTDAAGNVSYAPTTPTTPTTPKPTVTGTKWWESVIGIIPGLAAVIFGTQQQQVITPMYQPPIQNTGTNTNTILIGLVAIAALYFALNKKK